jgi:hypothetical protein
VSALPPEVRFAKHRLLPEIGARGQEALCAALFSVRPGDPVAREAAVQLARSGLRESATSPEATPLTVPEGLRAPRDPLLEVAFVAAAGALLATERVRTVVGVGGRPLSLPETLFREAIAPDEG